MKITTRKMPKQERWVVSVDGEQFGYVTCVLDPFGDPRFLPFSYQLEAREKGLGQFESCDSFREAVEAVVELHVEVNERLTLRGCGLPFDTLLKMAKKLRKEME